MKLLIAEDEPALRTSLVDYLRQDGYVVEAAASYEPAHEKIKLYRYDCVLLDLTLPDGNGLDVVRTPKADRSPAGGLSNRHSATMTAYREQ
ncbi:response regulator [Hymenobacter sp.]|uniref:response regulator transcription factor n=1 Tax=Hymenobacter sp. TaxID=1898978 RepID=UPI00286D223A|nr:response regulator [Hymenobacter sp.]